ncbi:MAG: hypothetical protein MAG431_01669 [Chloroflexi bacterium]|nr:hypothetical protein [Chloroflexota bacterium]
MRDDVERLRDILEAIQKIEKFTSKGRREFDVDERTQVWLESCRSRFATNQAKNRNSVARIDGWCLKIFASNTF